MGRPFGLSIGFIFNRNLYFLQCTVRTEGFCPCHLTVGHNLIIIFIEKFLIVRICPDVYCANCQCDINLSMV